MTCQHSWEKRDQLGTRRLSAGNICLSSAHGQCLGIGPQNQPTKVLGTEANWLTKVKRLVWGKNRNLTSLFLLE